MARLIYQPDIFRRSSRREIPAQVGARALDLLPAEVSRSPSLAAILNGRRLSAEELQGYRFAAGDELTCRIEPRGPLALLPMMIPMLLPTLAFVGISYGMQMATAALAGRKKENRKNYDNTNESPMYGWDGIQNTSRNGQPIPLVYGEHKVGGHFLTTFTRETEDGKQRLYALLSLGAGEFGSINGHTESATGLAADAAGDGFKINDNPVSIYPSVSVSYRMGTGDQAIIPGFRDQEPEFDVDALLEYDTPYTHTTQGQCDGFSCKLSFPQGLYGVHETGAILQYRTYFGIRYREDGTEDWTDAGSFDVTARTRSLFVKYLTIRNLPRAKYQIEVTRESVDDDITHVSTSYLGAVKEISIDDIAYKHHALVGVEAVATEQLNGRLPTFTSRVIGRKVVVYAPGDDFCEDGAQDLKRTADGARDWGWFAENTDRMRSAAIHSALADHMVIAHTAEQSSWTTSETTAPRAYKKVYGDFTASICGEWQGDPVHGYTYGLGVQCGGTDRFAYIGVRYYGGTYYWIFYSALSGVAQVTSEPSGSTTVWFRVARAEGVWTFYTSTDGSAWTERGSVEYVPPTASEYTEVGVFTQAQFATEAAFQFSEFTFSDSTSYSVESSSNPAWVCYDLCTNARWALGSHMNTSRLDLDAWVEFAAYANELVPNGAGGWHRRFRFDGAFDSPRDAWDAILRMLDNYRATILEHGDTLRLAYQKPETPTQLFTVANTKGSFRVIDSNPRLNSNYWEMQFLNRELDYEQDQVPYEDPDLDETEAYRRETTEVYGVTRAREAYSAGRYLCKVNRYLTQTAEWKAAADAIACQPYDVVSVQADMPVWGTGGGRVISSGPSFIVLDKLITLEEGYTYVVKIRHKSTDALETQTVTTGPGETNRIDVAEWTQRPEPSAIWVVGRENIATKQFRVVSMEISNTLECHLRGVYYRDEIYDDTVDVVPTTKYSELPNPRVIPGDIPSSSLILTERAQIMRDETVQNVLDVTFRTGAGAAYYEIYYRETGQDEWIYSGFTKGLTYTIPELLTEGTWYDVAVVSVGTWGAKKDPSLAPFRSHLIEGYGELPDDVTGLQVSYIRQTLVVKWDPVESRATRGYELRYGPTNDWTTATRLVGPYPATRYETVDIVPGTFWFLVKAINTSGLYSENAAAAQATIATPEDETVTVSREEGNEGWDGTKTDCTVDSGGDLVMDSAVTEMSYETPELDAGSTITGVARCTVQVLQDVPGGLVWDEIDQTWDSAWGAATKWDAAEDQPATHFQLSYRCGTSSGNLGSYTSMPLDNNLVLDLTGRYFQFKLTVTVDSTGYVGKATFMQSSVSEYA